MQAPKAKLYMLADKKGPWATSLRSSIGSSARRSCNASKRNARTPAIRRAQNRGPRQAPGSLPASVIAYMMAIMPETKSASPRVSKRGRWPGLRSPRSSTWPPMSTRTPIGRLTRKSSLQDQCSRTHPARLGPRRPPMGKTLANRPIAWFLRSSNWSLTIPTAEGISPPAPIPWMALKMINVQTLGATALSREPTVKLPTQNMKTCFRPKVSLNLPTTGIATIMASWEAVSVQLTQARETSRDWVIEGRATATIVWLIEAIKRPKDASTKNRYRPRLAPPGLVGTPGPDIVASISYVFNGARPCRFEGTAQPCTDS